MFNIQVNKRLKISKAHRSEKLQPVFDSSVFEHLQSVYAALATIYNSLLGSRCRW